jgi:hypothetical protein
MTDVKKMVMLLGVAVALTTVAQAEDFPRSKSGELPAALKFSLVGDRTSYFLGECILLHYRIANTGSIVQTISVGGDYRGSTRPDRFKVTAVSTAGTLVADPTPLMQNFGGGMMPGGAIKPGGEWFERVTVQAYCRFDAPGIYTIRAFHDLGFGPPRTNDPRSVAVTIELAAPTESEARAILLEAEKATPYGGPTWGQKGEARLDYHCIRWPTFLRPLEEMAQQGSAPAIEGIASIRTLDATRALVGLLKQTNTAFAARAAQLLEVRLPHPESDLKGPWGDRRRQFIIENAWDESLSLPARNYCIWMLKGSHRSDLLTAASLLRLIGTKREIPFLQQALEVAVAQTNAEYLADIHYPAPIRVADSLLGAARAIAPDLDVRPAENLSPGKMLLFFAKQGSGDKVLSRAEETVFARGLQHPLAYVRMKALESLPKIVPASLTNLVTCTMTDTSVGVQNHAFLAAGRMRDPQHRTISLAVLQTATDEWLMRAASGMAIHYNARYECALIWASRLVAPKDHNDYLPHEVIRQLFYIAVGNNTGGDLKVPRDADAVREMSARWRDFLEANKQKIADGRLFKIEELPNGLGIRGSRSSGVSVSP